MNIAIADEAEMPEMPRVVSLNDWGNVILGDLNAGALAKLAPDLAIPDEWSNADLARRVLAVIGVIATSKESALRFRSLSAEEIDGLSEIEIERLIEALMLNIEWRRNETLSPIDDFAEQLKKLLSVMGESVRVAVGRIGKTLRPATQKLYRESALLSESLKELSGLGSMFKVERDRFHRSQTLWDGWHSKNLGKYLHSKSSHSVPLGHPHGENDGPGREEFPDSDVSPVELPADDLSRDVPIDKQSLACLQEIAGKADEIVEIQKALAGSHAVVSQLVQQVQLQFEANRREDAEKFKEQRQREIDSFRTSMKWARIGVLVALGLGAISALYTYKSYALAESLARKEQQSVSMERPPVEFPSTSSN